MSIGAFELSGTGSKVANSGETGLTAAVRLLYGGVTGPHVARPSRQGSEPGIG